ncbi:hypothetical protein [Pseudomonas phoenicis]|uniref:hypothetical protein n=1 Tax=unclassified Pseudomonas TaxID=196821 RepID=UPI0039A0925E
MPPSSFSEHHEGLHSCLRLAQLTADQAFDRQREGKAWFECYLQTLESSEVTLFERTVRRLPFTPTDAVFEDVFAGLIPAPQPANLAFVRVASDLMAGLRQADLALLTARTACSRLNIDFDMHSDDTPVAILFHMHCKTDPERPRTRLIVELEHLGAKLERPAFERWREKLEARLQALSNLDEL